MWARAVTVVAALAVVPAGAVADRGAITLEVGPALSLVGASPSQGTGSTTLATGGGGVVGLRYALTNELELAGLGLWEASADYFHSGVVLDTPSGSVEGTLAERVQRYSILGGLHYVRGYVWRLHLGGEVGWSRESYSKRDLLDVSDPGNVHSFGLPLQDRTTDSLVLAPVAGIEWQFADHWSLTVIPRVEFLVGGTNRIALLVPVSIAHSWFLF